MFSPTHQKNYKLEYFPRFFFFKRAIFVCIFVVVHLNYSFNKIHL